jgi:hypothetical protein
MSPRSFVRLRFLRVESYCLPATQQLPGRRTGLAQAPARSRAPYEVRGRAAEFGRGSLAGKRSFAGDRRQAISPPCRGLNSCPANPTQD